MFTELIFSLRLYVEMYNQQNLYSHGLLSFTICKNLNALCSAHLQNVTLLLKALQHRICCLGIECREPRLIEAK